MQVRREQGCEHSEQERHVGLACDQTRDVSDAASRGSRAPRPGALTSRVYSSCRGELQGVRPSSRHS